MIVTHPSFRVHVGQKNRVAYTEEWNLPMFVLRLCSVEAIVGETDVRLRGSIRSLLYERRSVRG